MRLSPVFVEIDGLAPSFIGSDVALLERRRERSILRDFWYFSTDCSEEIAQALLRRLSSYSDSSESFELTAAVATGDSNFPSSFRIVHCQPAHNNVVMELDANLAKALIALDELVSTS